MLFHNYEYFLAIVEAKTISAAAEELFITQSALSKYLKRLEAALGTELFLRTGASLSLTYAGEQYLKTAQAIRQQEYDFRRVLEEIKRENRDSLSVGVSRWRSGYVLSKFLPAFQVAYPKIELNINVESSATILQNLQDQKTDIGILSLGLVQGNPSFQSDPLFEENLLLGANRSHPLVRKLVGEGMFAGYSIAERRYPAITLNDVRDEEFLMLENGRSDTKQIMDLFRSRGIVPRVSKHVHNVNSLLFGVASSMAFAFIPETGIANSVLPKEVVFLSLGADTVRVPVMAVTRARQGQPRITQEALEILRDVFHPGEPGKS